MFNDFWYDVLNNVNYKENFLVDVVEKDHLYEVYADLPGFAKEDIHLSFNNGYLTILAKHKEEASEGNYLLKERNVKSKKRSIYFGDINEEKITAKMENGVLKVQIFIKRPEEKKAKVIVIE